jgi:cell division protein FtsB
MVTLLESFEHGDSVFGVNDMTQNQTRFVSFFFWVICFLVTGYFTIHGLGLDGDKGYLSFSTFDQDISEARDELAELRDYRTRLEHRISLIATDEVDADFLSELARKNGGLYAPDELIFNLN